MTAESLLIGLTLLFLLLGLLAGPGGSGLALVAIGLTAAVAAVALQHRRVGRARHRTPR